MDCLYLPLDLKARHAWSGWSLSVTDMGVQVTIYEVPQ